MKRRKLWIGLAVILIALFVFFRMVNTMGPFVIIPEPFFPMSDNYSVDEKAMNEYYTDLFAGKSAADVISLFNRYNVMYRFRNGNQIRFFVAKTFAPIPVGYSGDITIEFKDGIFERVVSFGVFGIDAL